MKTPILLFLIILSCTVCAQKQLFVRVYDLSGKKIDKGKVLAVGDSALLLESTSKTDTIAVRNIGSIRTKRAPGHSIGVGMALGGVAGGIFGAIAGQASDKSPSSSDQWQTQVNVVSPAEAALLGMIVGVGVGALVGTICTTFNHSVHFVINGDAAKWKAFQLMVDNYNAGHQKKG